MTFNVPSGSGGGGGGGSYTGGNGIAVAGGTITNTGTIVQPVRREPRRPGVHLASR